MTDKVFASQTWCYDKGQYESVKEKIATIDSEIQEEREIATSNDHNYKLARNKSKNWKTKRRTYSRMQRS